jgi:hypothetical protein
LGTPENLKTTDPDRAKGRTARMGQAEKRAAGLLPVIGVIQSAGMISLRQIAAVLHDRGSPTARGGAGSAVQVQRVLARGP